MSSARQIVPMVKDISFSASPAFVVFSPIVGVHVLSLLVLPVVLALHRDRAHCASDPQLGWLRFSLSVCLSMTVHTTPSFAEVHTMTSTSGSKILLAATHSTNLLLKMKHMSQRLSSKSGPRHTRRLHSHQNHSFSARTSCILLKVPNSRPAC